MVQPPPGQDRMQLPVFSQSAVQPPAWQVKSQLPVPLQTKEQSAPLHALSQLPIRSQTHDCPALQVPPRSLPMLKHAGCERISAISQPSFFMVPPCLQRYSKRGSKCSPVKSR